MKILITEPNDYSEKALGIYRGLGSIHFFSSLTESERSSILREAEVLVIRLAHRIDASWLDKMPNLRVIATPTTGLNHIDLDEAERRGVKVISLKGHTSFLKDIPSTAEETLALMMALVRNLPWAFDDVKQGHWNRDAWRGHQFIHKTLGLIGVGRLGKIVAKYATALEMKIVGYDPSVTADAMAAVGVEKVSLEKLLSESHVASLHVPLEKATERMIGAKEFSLMKQGAYLVNTSRGEVVDESALLAALESGKLGGAALDVMTDEHADGRHLTSPLLGYARTHNNLLIVPHIGGATYEAMEVTEDFIANLIAEYFRKQ